MIKDDLKGKIINTRWRLLSVIQSSPYKGSFLRAVTYFCPSRACWNSSIIIKTITWNNDSQFNNVYPKKLLHILCNLKPIPNYRLDWPQLNQNVSVVKKISRFYPDIWLFKFQSCDPDLSFFYLSSQSLLRHMASGKARH